MAVLVIGLICSSFLYITVNNRPHLPSSVKLFCSLIPEEMKSEDAAFYISKYNNPYYSSIMMLSGIPQGSFYYYNYGELSDLETIRRLNTYFIYCGDFKEKALDEFREVVRFENLAILKRVDSR